MAVTGEEPPTVPYGKYHGTGNDFIVVEEADAGAIPDRRAFAIAHCDRHRGLGADGVLFVSLDADARPPRVRMRLVQPDGSVAAMCGNGARCVALWARRELGHVGSSPDELVVDADAGPRAATVDDAVATVEMGRPRFEPEAVPVARERPMVEASLGGFAVTAVSTGVPHAVAFVDDVDDVDLERVAPPIRHADVFPEGANVTVAAVRDDGGLDQRTFERGVEGETASCGTGAVAAVAVAVRLGLLDAARARAGVEVHPPGGTLEIRLPEDGPATLTGPVVHEGEDRLPAVPSPVDDGGT